MNDNQLIQDIRMLVSDLSEEITELRRTIHQDPELSFVEYNTANLIYCRLKEIAILEVIRPTATSVHAILKGSMPGKTIALRCDLDALALQEENDVTYKSRNDGVMHACGHDGHAAILVGAAKALVRLRDKIKGEIHFIFQHAEEKHPGGAKDLVKLGILEGVDMILAIHLWAALSSGKVGLSSGPLMAAPDNFDISIIGRGGHAAMPQEAIDPILVSAQAITSLQSIVSRQNNPIDPLVLTVTSIRSGSAYNIIPEKVDLRGTVRTFNRDLRSKVPKMMEQILDGVCSAYGAKYHFNYERGYDPVVNDHIMVAAIKHSLVKIMGEECIENVNPVMGGEDFSEYQKLVPGVLIFIGAQNIEKGIVYPHHHPNFNIDESALEKGLEVLIWSVLGLVELQ